MPNQPSIRAGRRIPMKSPAERSMGTATATTVSTVVSDYTMASGGTRKEQKNARTNDAGRGTAPVVWYAFYSEKAAREYYYEPISRTVTWVMPDDYHPHPDNHDNDAADQPALMPAPKVKRKVSWVSSAKSEACLHPKEEEKGAALSSDGNNSESTVEKTTMGKRLLTGAACIVVLGGAFCLGRLSDTGLNAGSATSRSTFVSMPSFVPEDRQRLESVTEYELERGGTGYEIKVVRVAVPGGNGAETSERPPEEMQRRENDEKDEEEKDLSPSAPAKCKIPFAYVVSGECRRREVPLFDAEAFSLLMMQ